MMDVKLFGDRTPINWAALNVRMPFAPMHELAERYKDELITPELGIARWIYRKEDIERTFETKIGTTFRDIIAYQKLPDRINYRLHNTIAALNQCTPDTICINMGGGMHHSGKYPNTGYAYSLINDIIWAVDYQLEQARSVGIIDLDFHFGGGTYAYYDNIFIVDLFHPKGVLQKHTEEADAAWGLQKLDMDVVYKLLPRDKYLLNIGTDWYKHDTLFGKYGNMEAEDLLNVWKDTIMQIIKQKIPVAITMGGGYGSAGLELYVELIEWLKSLTA